jgi:RHS repeat-associated protein
VVTDEDGKVTQTLDYHPYGSQRIATGPFSEQRRFIGEEYDGDTEFSYLNARYYQGSCGQFLSQNPVFVNLGVDKMTPAALADPHLQNSHVYGRNNPLVNKDNTGEFSILLNIGGALAAQYGYDVYNNVQANGFNASAFYSNLSSPETYATRAVQGAAVAVSGGIIGGARLGFGTQIGLAGGASGAIGALGNVYLGEPITAQSIIANTVIGGATFGAVRSAPLVPGRSNFGTRAFFTGKHTQQSSLRLGVESTSSYLSTLVGNASLGRPLSGSGSAASGSYNTFGLKANTQITGENVGAFISFISQFLKK